MLKLSVYFFLGCAWLGTGAAADRFEIYPLRYSGKVVCSHVEDVNNDGLNDILLLLRHEKSSLSFSLFLQTEAGFSSIAQQHFPVPQQMVVFDVGNVDTSASKEFVYFRPDGVFYYRFTHGGFDVRPQRLIKTESIFMLANINSLDKWDFVSDFNQDGVDDLFVPGVTESAIYFRQPDSSVWRKNRLSLRPEVRLHNIQPSRFSLGAQARAALIMPYILWEDFDADGRDDLLAVYPDSLMAFCQRPDGSFESTRRQKVTLNAGDLWPGAKIHRNRIGAKRIRQYLLKVTDLNDDGLLDLVTTHISTEKSFVNPENDIQIFFGKMDSSAAGGLYFSAQPDDVIRPGGTHLVIDIIDLNRDGLTDLVIPVVKVGLRNIIRMMLTKSVEIHAETYLMRRDGFFPEQPDLRNKVLVKFTYRGGATSPVYEIADFNGDGYNDILTSAGQKQLILFWGDKNDIIASRVGEDFRVPLPQNGERVNAMDLNNDGKCDVIISYGDSDGSDVEGANQLLILLAN